MKVKFLKLSAGPNGVIQPGTVVEVSPAEAEILHKGRYACPLEPMQKQEAEEPGDFEGEPEREPKEPRGLEGESDLESEKPERKKTGKKPKK